MDGSDTHKVLAKECKIKTWLKKIIYPSDYNSPKLPSNGPVEFDDAIAATGFGKFNLLLMLFAIPSTFGTMCDTTSMSYVITSAECDLRLSLVDKGLINGITHLGMISFGFFSGYLTDTLGRRNILIYGYLLDSLCNMIAVFSQNAYMLAGLKFIAGCLITGPCTVVIICLSEFFSTPLRPMIVMYVGMCFSLGTFALPFVAWLFLAEPTDIVVTSGLVIHSWQIFMAVCCLPSLIAGLSAIMIPESPRFLLSRGRKVEALETLKKVYASNNKCSPESFPVKELMFVQPETKSFEMGKKAEATVENAETEPKEKKEGSLSALRGGFNQIRPLLLPPHLKSLLIVIIVEFGCITGCNTLRLWLPQLFKMISENMDAHSSLCDMISLGNNSIVVPPVPASGECTPITIDHQIFVNSAIVAGIQVVLCSFSSFVINAVGKKELLVTLLTVGGICSIAMYWCTNILQATMLAAFSVAVCSISSNALMSVIVDLFPTSLRATASSFALMVGRSGSIIGNVTFPVLLAFGCLPPFLTLGSLLIGCSLIALTIPKAKEGQI